MDRYLVFQLHGPMASWGLEAPGEVRHTSDIPTKSALLGLCAAALGIRREDAKGLKELEQNFQFIVCGSIRGKWARDYHTVQMPKREAKTTFLTRKDELCRKNLLNTLVTVRDYFSDVWWLIAVRVVSQKEGVLENLQSALLHPTFVLYLGRKSFPLSRPLYPLIFDGTAADVLVKAKKIYEEKLKKLQINYSPLGVRCYWEGTHEGLTESCVVRRRDVPQSRKNWQFEEREIKQGKIAWEEEACISQS